MRDSRSCWRLRNKITSWLNDHNKEIARLWSMLKFHFPMAIIIVSGVPKLNNSFIMKWLWTISVVNFCFCLWRVRHSCGNDITRLSGKLDIAKLKRKGGNRSCKMWQVILMQAIAMIQLRNYLNWKNKVLY